MVQWSTIFPFCDQFCGRLPIGIIQCPTDMYFELPFQFLHHPQVHLVFFHCMPLGSLSSPCLTGICLVWTWCLYRPHCEHVIELTPILDISLCYFIGNNERTGCSKVWLACGGIPSSVSRLEVCAREIRGMPSPLPIILQVCPRLRHRTPQGPSAMFGWHR